MTSKSHEFLRIEDDGQKVTIVGADGETLWEGSTRDFSKLVRWAAKQTHRENTETTREDK